MFDLIEGGFSFCFLFTLQGPLEQRNELGIMFRHAYSLTAVERVRLIFTQAWEHLHSDVPRSWVVLQSENKSLCLWLNFILSFVCVVKLLVSFNVGPACPHICLLIKKQQILIK